MPGLPPLDPLGHAATAGLAIIKVKAILGYQTSEAGTKLQVPQVYYGRPNSRWEWHQGPVSTLETVAFIES